MKIDKSFKFKNLKKLSRRLIKNFEEDIKKSLQYQRVYDNMGKTNFKIAILGAGSWGTTLSILLEKKGYNISLWEKFKENVEDLDRYRENRRFLPGVIIPQRINITSDLEKAVSNVSLIVIAIPSHTVRDIVICLAKLIKRKDVLIVSAVKGIERESLLRMSEVISCFLSNPVVVLSGPSHAEEVSRDIPTTVVVSGKDDSVENLVQNIFMGKTFRVYTNRDMIGVELGGALKNVIAIATGISDGLGFGDNTKAALMTRGLREITRLGVIMGADPRTFSGLAGIGDLIATCTSRYSRNRYLGERIGEGKTLDEALRDMVMVAEGVSTTIAAKKLAEKAEIELPITNQVYEVLFKMKDPKLAVAELMERQAKREFE